MKRFDSASLKPYNTFGIDVKARHLCFCQSKDEIKDLISEIKNDRTLIIGGGSNLLFLSDFDGVVIAPCIQGIEVVEEQGHTVTIRAGAGVVWDDLVAWCVERGYSGLENLSLIPGHVGASPVQNIGAYGVEAGDSITNVEGVFIQTGEDFRLSKQECQFGYRQSIFKNEFKNRCVITSVEFLLSKSPQVTLSYGAVRSEVEKLGEVNLQNIRKAIIAIRESKLPDPALTGNAGSFFKNPEVDEALANSLKQLYNDLVIYPLQNGKVKLPAGWLIEKAGWKGFRRGAVGVHDKQALVLVNYGGATGHQVLELAHEIQASVHEKFKVSLEMEVNTI